MQKDLYWPLIVALRNLGGSANMNDIADNVEYQLKLTREQVTVKIPSGASTRLQNRLGWAGFELKKRGILTYPSTNRRELTELGRTITETELAELLGDPPPESLEPMVERFLQETGYPTEADEEQKRLRAEWAEKLRPENISSISREELSAVMNAGIRGCSDYVNAGSGPTKFFREMEPAKYEHLLRTVEYLCWGQGDFSERFDAVDAFSGTMGETHESGYMKLSGSFVSKLLAITHPDRFLPTGGHKSSAGRRKMLARMGLPILKGTIGRSSVDANDRLRGHLAPYFDDDPHAITSFLYWTIKRESPTDGGPPPTPTHPEGPDLNRLASDLLVDVKILNDVVDLLEDKGQVILYGPPGTGKTYLARELAKVLAPEESRRALVQFHPSTSYEDFFEGYRPAGNTADGGIRYELTPGPLARMAERASEAPGKKHVMVIDEINRGNLPRVLGELLFLLEYRNESIHPLYRPEEQFSLPENLLFIGTMNTADRSIALVDAALRRRFHFVPFFPDRKPIEGLLGRWLNDKDQPAWVARVVDAVNDELARDLDGSHLLLGPSHFMKDYGATPDEQEQRLRRIWEYNIEPFIEDQFFGDPDRIRHYRFDKVFDRHRPAAGSASGPDGAGDADEDATPDASATSPGDDATENVAEGAADEDDN